MVYRFTFRFLEVWPGLARNRSLHPAVRRPRPQNRHRHAAAWMLEASSAFFFARVDERILEHGTWSEREPWPCPRRVVAWGQILVAVD